MKAALGSLDRVERIVKLGVFVNSAPAFTDQPKVANGASELMQDVFGEAGRHARSAVGVPCCRSASPSKSMRSSPSTPDPLDPGPAGFAHRGLHYGAAFPENSLIAFAAALELGAGIECDLRLTADNQIVVFHDADAWRMCASPMRIGASTLEELGAAEGRRASNSDARKPPDTGRRAGAAAARDQGRERYLALGAGAPPRARRLWRPVRRDELRSADSSPDEDQPARCSPGPCRPRQPAAAPPQGVALWLAAAAIPRGRSRGARRDMGGARAPADAGLQLDDPHRRRARASRGSGRCAHLGSRWPTVKLRSSRDLRPGVAAVDAAQWDALAAGDPLLSHAFLSSLEEFGQRRAGHRLVAGADPGRRGGGACSPPRPPISRATARASMCSTTAGPRRGKAPAGVIIPSSRSPCRSRRCPGCGCLGLARSSC